MDNCQETLLSSIINTLTHENNGQLNERVTNITGEDVWLHPHTRIGVHHEIKDVEDTKNNIDFKGVSVNEEMVFLREARKAVRVIN